ncbi:uncharacterized protein LOC131956666 [Physella acuta]|uniref:uncharacterized protein LOC131956666 n=1 Tax=Physella acuta TaxID=109671 RepID=UPI0027DCB51D|nr:uncharacterized protein LOC131956666 [Physella acuta]
MFRGVKNCPRVVSVPKLFWCLLGVGVFVLIIDRHLSLHGVDRHRLPDKALVHTTRQTQACVFPDLDPFDPSILKIAGLEKGTLQCPGYAPDLTYVTGTRLMVNKTLAELTPNLTGCRYRPIYRHPDSDKNVTFGAWSPTFTEFIDLSRSAEFILCVCENSSRENVSKTYHALVPDFPDIGEIEAVRLKKRQVQARPRETLNVVMIGLDGLSRHQFLRSMNRTRTLLLDELTSYDMRMHTQSGTNTFPNFISLLTGHSKLDIFKWWDFRQFSDSFDLLWEDFNRAGYRTLFAEDQPIIAAFHFMQKGFLRAPVVHYSHPISVAMEQDEELFSPGKHCVGNTPELVFNFNYIERFLDKFKGRPVFAMQFHTKLTHSFMTDSVLADEHMYRFYRSLQQKGHLNNTLLLTFSDHGPRWGAIRASMNGMVESRTPYAIFTFPQWFLDKYPDVAQNLKTNTGRLTSHFDTHATLQDLLYFKASGVRPFTPGKHGISLFQEIPLNRTCDDVPIPVEFCVCNQQQMEQLPTNSSLALGFAQLVLNSINWKRNASICHELSLRSVLQVVNIKLPTVSVDYDKRLFKVKVQTTPGDAIFEATIQTSNKDNAYINAFFSQSKKGGLLLQVGDTIERLTMYGAQADCELEATRKPFCYCRNYRPDTSH